MPVKVVGMVGRQQGLLVKKGNPKRIISLEQLVQSNIRFINRQRGAGTRVLLDYRLGRLGIAVQDIQGYNDEEFTHLAVAVAVASGRADVGLGICAAARALDLDFIPLFQERYDLVIPTEYFDTPFLKPLLELLDDPTFRQAVQELPGYDVTPMGVLIAEME